MNKPKTYEDYRQILMQDPDIKADFADFDQKSEEDKKASQWALDLMIAVLILEEAPRRAVLHSVGLAQKIKAEVALCEALKVSLESFRAFQEAGHDINDYDTCDELRSAYTSWVTNKVF
jgi:hypothetical protein